MARKRQEITGEVQPSDLEIAVRQEVEQRRERLEREAKCDEALQKVLDEHNCNLATYFNGGQGNLIPTPQIVVLPVILKSASR